MINKLLPNTDPVAIINNFLIYYLSVNIFIQYYLHKEINIKFSAYLSLPINRLKLIIYYLIHSPFSVLNFSLLLFIIPFSIINILPVFGTLTFILYLSSIIFLLIITSYFVMLLKGLTHYSIYFGIVPWISLIIPILLKTVFNISLGNLTTKCFSRIVQGQINFPSLLFFLILVLFLLNISLIKRTFYQTHDDIQSSFGDVGNPKILFSNKSQSIYSVLAQRLILRNRRLQFVMLTSVCFIILFYYIFLHKQLDFCFLFVMCVLLNGIFGYMLGQYLFSWESSFFDFLSVTNFHIVKYLIANYLLYVKSSFFVLIILLTLVLQKKMELHLLLTSFLFNCGIGYFIVLFMATFNKTRIELNSTPLFDTRNYNSAQILTLVLTLVVPYLILLVLTSFLSQNVSLAIIDIISFLSLLYYKKWFKRISQHLIYRKYINLEGYRK
ncbi:MAG: hypothetical protein JXB49_25070 [Bacteroidales bacterium]|nr:hypothetical protein [Bacteroidales bacterium]